MVNYRPIPQLTPKQIQKFWNRVTKTDSCWLWTGRIDESGYGRTYVSGAIYMAHRIAYQLTHGSVPTTLTLDHVKSRGCTHRNCVNPSHLEPITLRENILRGSSLPAQLAARTECKRGHNLLNPDNIRIINHPKRPYRICLLCRRIDGREAMRKLRARKRATHEDRDQ